MYTNSEMFEFYHGLTGFANVFPTAKFEDLSLQYTSDGYLNEGDNEIFVREGDRIRERRKGLWKQEERDRVFTREREREDVMQ